MSKYIIADPDGNTAIVDQEALRVWVPLGYEVISVHNGQIIEADPIPFEVLGETVAVHHVTTVINAPHKGDEQPVVKSNDKTNSSED